MQMKFMVRWRDDDLDDIEPDFSYFYETREEAFRHRDAILAWNRDHRECHPDAPEIWVQVLLVESVDLSTVVA
jgi:hypothetical protein